MHLRPAVMASSVSELAISSENLAAASDAALAASPSVARASPISIKVSESLEDIASTEKSLFVNSSHSSLSVF